MQDCLYFLKQSISFPGLDLLDQGSEDDRNNKQKMVRLPASLPPLAHASVYLGNERTKKTS